MSTKCKNLDQVELYKRDSAHIFGSFLEAAVKTAKGCAWNLIKQNQGEMPLKMRREKNTTHVHIGKTTWSMYLFVEPMNLR